MKIYVSNLSKKAILIFAFVSMCFSSNAQTEKDSLLRLIGAARQDTNKVLLLISLGQLIESGDPEQAKTFYYESKKLSEKLGYTMGVLKYYANYGAALNSQSKYDSGLILSKEALLLALKFGNKDRLARCFNNLGASYLYLEDYENAIDNFLQGAAIIEDLKLTDQLDIVYSNIATLYVYTKLYSQSEKYHKKAVESARALQIPLRLATALHNYGGFLTSTHSYDSAKVILFAAWDLVKNTDYDFDKCNILLNISNLFLHLGDYRQLDEYAKKAAAYSMKVGDSLSYAIASFGEATSLFFANNMDAAAKKSEMGLAICLRNNFKEKQEDFYNLLSKIAIAQNDLVKYDKYDRLGIAVGDSLLNEKIQKNLQLLDKRFETTKKNLVIEKLENDKKIGALWNYILLGSALSILLIALLSYRNYRHKQQLQQQRITELEKEKQLLATEAVLKGQEEERSRLAKDLHDGLGGMLSGIKYSFSNMKETLIMTPDNMLGFQRGLDMLDSSISELRRVAHSMMPEALMKFGLNAALKDFCTSINNSGVLKVIYQSHDADNLDISQTASVTIYRIVQELLNNSIKHAAATQVLVQLNKEDNKLLLTVEDDGKGFDIASLQEAKVRTDGSVGRGIGWTNIKSRLDYLKGKLDVQSEPGKGTSVNIEISL